MRGLLRLAARLYPASWRKRYGPEFDALLEQTTPSPRNVLDVARGGIVTRIRSAAPAALVVALGIAGGVMAGTMANLTSHRVESTMTLTFQRSAAGANADANSDDRKVLDLTDRALDASFMASLGERSEVEGNTRISLTPPGTLRLSYASYDSNRSQALVREMATHVVEGLLSARLSGATMPAGIVRVVSGPSTPRPSATPARILTASALGIAVGLLCGLRMTARKTSS